MQATLIRTHAVSNRPMTTIRAMDKRCFMCIAPKGTPQLKLQFDVNMLAAGTVSDLKKLERWASSQGLSNDEYAIFHVCDGGRICYKYDLN